MTTPQGPAARVAALRTALQTLGDALAAPAVAPLAAAESALAAAIAGLTPLTIHADSLPSAARAALLDDLQASRAALARARRLGDSLNAFASASLHDHGLVSGYDCRGDEAVRPPSGHFGVRG